MYKPIEIAQDTFWIGVNDRESDLFEAMWPLPEGISYNAYIIDSDKVALVETVKKTHLDSYIERIRAAIPQHKSVEYLIINHMEPDHSGAISVLTQLFPDMKIVGNKKTMEFLHDFYGITHNTLIIADGETLDLGGHKLTFHITPMVHWPETMMTYDETTGVIFSGDAFGGFKTLDGGIFDEEVHISAYDDELLRYYSNIIGKFSPMVHKAIKKIKDLEIGIIASTHGPVWRQNPAYVIDKYDLWSQYTAEPGVVLAYASMYGNTLKMAEAVARGLAEAGLKEIRMHDVSRSHPSYIISDAWKYKGIILGSCTYELGIFPPMRNLVALLEEKVLKNRIIGIFGSYGWSGGAVKGLREFAEKTAWDLIEPIVEVKCSADEQQLGQCTMLGRNMAYRLQSP